MDPERERQILLERARVLAISTREEGGEGRLLQVVAFLLGQRGYALEVCWVREILPPPRVAPIPGAPSFVLGVINVRGNIITLTDLEEFLEVGKIGDSHSARKVLILEGPGIQTGILVDGVSECLSIPESSVEAPLMTIEENKLECLLGQIRIRGKVYALLSGRALLGNPRLIVE
jgi:purine-binding chemotaxis protein CheW